MPSAAIIALDFVLWPVIHLAAVAAALAIPLEWLERRRGWFRLAAWEQGGRVYERWFKVRRWKHRLPDGAKLLRRGYSTTALEGPPTPDKLHRFYLETCRSEIVHWLQLLPAPLFFLWNPWYAGVIILIYALLVNAPCIIAQRYNRGRLGRAAGR